MICTSPPELTEIQLAMALEDEADDEIVTHLAGCPFCQKRAIELTRLQSQFHRPLCPSSGTLRDFHFQLLPAAASAKISHHVAICPQCTRELCIDYAGIDMEFETAPSSNAKASGPLTRIRLWIADLVDTLAVGGPSPTFAMRNSEMDEKQFWSRIYQVAGTQILLELEPSLERPSEQIVVGSVSSRDHVPLTDAYLWRADELIASVTVEDTGDFEFAETPAITGQYELFLSGPDAKIHVPDIQLDAD